jgi:transposase
MHYRPPNKIARLVPHPLEHGYGKKRAIRAVAHAIMVSAFYMLARNEPYRELGSNYFDERRRHYTVDRLATRLERLGYRVHLEPVMATTE